MIRFSFVLALVACSASVDATSPFAEGPLMDLTSAEGKVLVEVRTAPTQPPSRGTSSVELFVRDRATGKPLDGLTVDVLPWMTAHNHGSSIPTFVEPKGDGRYLVTNVSFFMPGTWELRTTFHGPIEDHVAPSLDVP